MPTFNSPPSPSPSVQKPMPNRSHRRRKWYISILAILTIALIVLIVPSAVIYSKRHSKSVSQLPKNVTWTLDSFKGLVTFGDSYTDEGRVLYFGEHNGNAPPVGWESGVTNMTAVGGYVWPRWVSWYTGIKTYNYAVGGAVCSNAIIGASRGLQGVNEYEIGAYVEDTKRKNFIKLSKDETVYVIWVGTNDLGSIGFLTNSQTNGTTVDNYVDCVFEQIERMAKLGARKVVLMNVIPLDRLLAYASAADGGEIDDRYWADKPANLTTVSLQMKELVGRVNYAFRQRTGYEAKVKGRFDGAEVAMFDVHSLFTDILQAPQNYLNGTGAPIINEPCMKCPVGATMNTECKICTNPDSHLWYDELHPSEQASRVIAKEFVNVVSGHSKYTTYWK